MYLALALLMLVAISCGSPEPVEPTPDVASFAEGEASAMVMDKIRQIWGSRGACEPSLLGDMTDHYRGGRVWDVSAEYRPRRFEPIVAWDHRGTFPSNWESWKDGFIEDLDKIEGTELLKGPFETIAMEWVVYETSHTVAPANTTTEVSHLFCGAPPSWPRE